MDVYPLLKVAGTLFLTYSSYYGAVKIYSTFCVPDSVLGYLQGMITTGSLVCAATLAYASNSQPSYATIISMTFSRAIIDAVLPSSPA